jgi:hypothetical protein
MGIYYIRLGISPVNTGGMIYIYIHARMACGDVSFGPRSFPHKKNDDA